jgi:hypothetical protein
MRIYGAIAASLLLLIVATLAWMWPRYPYLAAVESPWQAQRVLPLPVLFDTAAEHGYVNLNGPTVVRVPGWVENPLGRYYMYFAHHKGSYIRLAYADEPLGPWQVYHPGVLPLAASGFPDTVGEEPGSGALAELFKTFSLHVIRDYLMLVYRASVTDQTERNERGMTAAANQSPHVASPEIVIDNINRRFLMYYHGFDERGSQSSRVAASKDGMIFEVQPGRVFSTYLRSFKFRGQHYLLGMPGVIYRGDDPLGPFEPRNRLLFEPDMRHAGVLLEGSTLYVFWSKVGYAPERILLSQVDLDPGDWNDWKATAPVDLMRPEQEWEGNELIAMPSLRGELDNAANELRDPFAFRDDDGQLYLFYVGGGEKAIGVARLTLPQTGQADPLPPCSAVPDEAPLPTGEPLVACAASLPASGADSPQDSAMTVHDQ